MKFLAFNGSGSPYNGGDLSFGEAAIISVVSILMVFFILFLIVLSVDLFHFLFTKFSKPVANNALAKTTNTVKKSTEIKDEDMMVAALIATIDYRQEVKKDVRLKSIKRVE